MSLGIEKFYFKLPLNPPEANSGQALKGTFPYSPLGAGGKMESLLYENDNTQLSTQY